MLVIDPQLMRRLREALERRPEILDGYLFGSHARGEARAHSDVDVAVYLRDEQPVDEGFGYASTLAADLMAALGRNDVDVVILNRAPPLLYHRVLRDGERILARDLRETTVREGRALSRYCDYVPQLAKIDALLSGRPSGAEPGR